MSNKTYIEERVNQTGDKNMTFLHKVKYFYLDLTLQYTIYPLKKKTLYKLFLPFINSFPLQLWYNVT